MTRANTVPKYGRIKRDLLHRIQSGALAPGDAVPGEMALAAEYGVSRTSTRLALRDLAMEGYVIRVRGQGTRVAQRTHTFQSLHQGANRLAFVLPDELSLDACSIFQAFSSEAARDGFVTTGIPIHARQFNDRDAHEPPMACDAAIVWGALDLPSALAGAPVVRVTAAQTDVDDGADRVVLPHAAAIESLTAEIARRGHRRVGLVAEAGPIGDTCEAACMRVLRRTASSGSTCVRVNADPHQSFSVAMRLLALPRRPTALICACSGLTDRLVAALRRLDYHGPDDLMLATVDPISVGTKLWPRLRAVYSPVAVARHGLDMVRRRIAQPDAPSQMIEVRAAIETTPATILSLARARVPAPIAHAAGL